MIEITYLAKVRENVGCRVLGIAFGLLFLRIVILGIGVYLIPDLKKFFLDSFVIGTYLLTVLFIMVEYDTLRDYHFDKLAIVVILVLKPIMALFRISVIYNLNPHLGFRHELYVNGIIIIAAILALVFIFRKNSLKTLEPVTMKWIAIGFLVGLATAFIITWAAFIAGSNPNIQISLKEMPLTLLIQLTNAAVYEEPLFRGILWGAMRKMDFEDKWIWIIQAILFLIGHIYYLNLQRCFLWC